MAKQTPDPTLPDWWQREKQRRQTWILLFLVTMLMLIGIYYWVSGHGRIGAVKVVDFDTRKNVAFIHLDKDGNSTLYAIRTDGTELKPLTSPDDKSNKQDPSWTVDGKSLLYASNRGDNKVTQIYLLGQGDPRQLTYGTGNKFQPIASADGKRILFLSQGFVKTVLLNGNDVLQVLPDPRNGNSGAAEDVPTGMDPHGPFLSAYFSSNGEAIAGVQSLEGEDAPTTMGEVSAGDQIVRIQVPGVRDPGPLEFGKLATITWEPTGERLATSFNERYGLGPDGKETAIGGIRLWQFDPKTGRGAPTALISFLGNKIQTKKLAWSKDGKLAFEVWYSTSPDRHDPQGIAVMQKTDTPMGTVTTAEEAKAFLGLLMLKTDAQGIPLNPQWSPDGGQLMFEKQRPDGGHDLWIVNSDGTGMHNITEKLGGDNVQASWAPTK